MDANTYYLNEHMSKLDKDEEKMDWIDDRVKELMKRECNPFNPRNIQEAISELSWADSCLFGAYVEAAANSQSKILSQTYLADFIVQITTKYWNKCAVNQAEREYDERII